jgi:nucleoside-diphosphate-sugar epimerase
MTKIKTAFVTGGSGFVGRDLIRILKENNISVRALARSDKSIDVVKSLGAIPIQGDLDSLDAMADGMQDCDVIFHAAAFVDDWGRYDEIYKINVTGTENVLEAAKRAKVPRLIHLSTEAVYVGGQKLKNADETLPLPNKTLGMYPRSKAQAEKIVVANNGPDLQTVVVRPRFIWGVDDTSLLPKVLELVRNGDFMWINSGKYLTSTCNIKNLSHALVLAAQKGLGGECYFITDGEPIELRAFFIDWLGTQGVDPGTKSIPYWFARVLGYAVDSIWTLIPIKKRPPITTATVLIMGEEVTLDVSKAAKELGYKPIITRDEGLQAMRNALK